jgi:transposase
MLPDNEIQEINHILEKGTHSARVITRGRILLQRYQKFSYTQIALNLGISNKLIYTVCERYCQHGLEYALTEQKRTGKPKIITPFVEAKVTALTCTDPPIGRDHWSSAVLKKELFKQFQIQISETSIKRIWRAHKLKPWKKKCGASLK